MSVIKYPDGKMANFRRKPFSMRKDYRDYHRPKPPWWHKRHSKYNAQKVTVFDTTCDSKAEARYFCLLKSNHKNFVYHHRYLLKPHIEYPYHGHVVKVQKRTYCPDFIIWKRGQAHDWFHPSRIIDVKGQKHVTVGANRQMDDLSRELHVPVTIVRFDYLASRRSGLIVFNDEVKGTHVKYQETALPLAHT